MGGEEGGKRWETDMGCAKRALFQQGIGGNLKWRVETLVRVAKFILVRVPTVLEKSLNFGFSLKSP